MGGLDKPGAGMTIDAMARRRLPDLMLMERQRYDAAEDTTSPGAMSLYRDEWLFLRDEVFQGVLNITYATGDQAQPRRTFSGAFFFMPERVIGQPNALRLKDPITGATSVIEGVLLHEVAADQTPAPARRDEAARVEDLRAWYLERLGGGSHTAEQDEKDARERFGPGLRDEVRKLRRVFSPSDARKGGRPRKNVI